MSPASRAGCSHSIPPRESSSGTGSRRCTSCPRTTGSKAASTVRMVSTPRRPSMSAAASCTPSPNRARCGAWTWAAARFAMGPSSSCRRFPRTGASTLSATRSTRHWHRAAAAACRGSIPSISATGSDRWCASACSPTPLLAGSGAGAARSSERTAGSTARPRTDRSTPGEGTIPTRWSRRRWTTWSWWTISCPAITGNSSSST